MGAQCVQSVYTILIFSEDLSAFYHKKMYLDQIPIFYLGFTRTDCIHIERYIKIKEYLVSFVFVDVF